MGANVQVLAIIVTAVLFGVVFELVRRRRLMERYALLWLFASALMLALSVWRDALEGLADLVATLRRVRATFNPALDIAGVLLTMYDERTNLGQQVARDVREFFKEKVFHTVIPRNVRLGEAPSHGVPGVLYDTRSRGAESYVALAREILARDTRQSHEE